MATKIIVSGENVTPVGTAGTKLFTRTRSTYTLDENGKIDPNSVKQEILYSQVPGDPPVIAATRNGTTGDFTFKKNEFTGQFYFGADAQKSLKQGALKTTTQQQIQTSAKKEGLTPEQQKTLTNNANIASPNAGVGTDSRITKEENALMKEEAKARKSYGINIKYPEKLNAQFQDCIKFSIIDYKPSGIKGFGESTAGSRVVTVNEGKVGIGERTVIGSIILPIPGGIRDSNTVNWNDDTLNPFAETLANIAISELETGTGAEAARSSANEAVKAQNEIRSTIASKVATAVAGQGAGGIIQRQYGRIINPNLELLFNGPELRNFSFLFKLSPRSESEARIVKQIIRTFKQAMSVQRTNSSFLLQTPNTFAISYIFQNKQHPYLNKFKECALKGCSVNYTPEGNYMAFDSSTDPSMVSYELELQFQELEPLYNDEYSQDNDATIGF